MHFEGLDRILEEIKKILKSDQPIEDDIFIPLAGKYSKELKKHLSLYHQKREEEKRESSPYLNYYRQIQHYFIFIARFPTILTIPHHSEILQTLYYIENKEKLIKEKYNALAAQKRTLLEKENLEKMESLLNKHNLKELHKK